MNLFTVLIVFVVLLLLFGGGYGGYRNGYFEGSRGLYVGGGGLLTVIVFVLIAAWLLGRF